MIRTCTDAHMTVRHLPCLGGLGGSAWPVRKEWVHPVLKMLLLRALFPPCLLVIRFHRIQARWETLDTMYWLRLHA
jgi:hypothetical protein